MSVSVMKEQRRRCYCAVVSELVSVPLTLLLLLLLLAEVGDALADQQQAPGGSGVDDGSWLQLLYKETTNGTDSNEWGWNMTIGANPCSGNISQWSGVFCLNGRVFQIDLPNTGLTGTLPAVNGDQMSELVFLDLSLNNLIGTLPSSWSSLSRLRFLHLYGNQLSGSLPSEWSSLSGLLYLYLGYNELTGSLPPSWGTRTAAMQSLFLNNNQLTGSLPASWGNFTGLNNLYLGSNQLSGSLPAEWDALIKLIFPTAPMVMRNVYLNNNSFSGPFPTSWVTSSPPPQVALMLEGNCLSVSSINRTDVDWWKLVAGTTYAEQRTDCSAMMLR